jgi:hypothetical protein
MYRERAENVIDVSCQSDNIQDGIETQVASGGYRNSTLYGDGTAGKQIAELIAELDIKRKEPMKPTDLPGVELVAEQQLSD